MQINTSAPYSVNFVPHLWITLSDGTRLSCCIWKPSFAEEAPHPIPAILEYIPYRKYDGTALRDSLYHPLFAAYGYASVRVDIRGSGDSEGIISDEYSQQELDDAVEVINWLAKQSWCSGAVGMMGKSWGGFNALQVAAKQPKALKAIISVCSTDDRYGDDVHFKGGCVMTTDMPGWATTMAAWNARPPAEEVVGHHWVNLWRERCEQTPMFIEKWLKHQCRDNYWKHGSICEDYSAIKAATLLVGGWADPYSNAIPRMMEGLTCPRQAIIGPWAHEYPQRAKPGPQIGFTQECLRWWDYWLKDSDNDVMQEPTIRSYLVDSMPAMPDYLQRAGRWIGVEGFTDVDCPAIQPDYYYLRQGKLSHTNHAPFTATTDQRYYAVASDLSVGFYAGCWFPMGAAGDYATDQRQTDANCLCFDSDIVTEEQAILGNPELTLRVKANQTHALVAARLCAVDEQGRSSLVSWGLLNLCHRESHQFPKEVVIDEWMTVKLSLNAIGYTLLAGYRWRLALSPSYTAHAWPSPRLVTLTIDAHETHLQLPNINTRGLPEPRFAEPECFTPILLENESPSTRSRMVKHDAVDNAWLLHDKQNTGIQWLNGYIGYSDYSEDLLEVIANNPLSTNITCYRIANTGTPEYNCRCEVKTIMCCSERHFHIEWQLSALLNDEVIFEKEGSFDVEREFV